MNFFKVLLHPDREEEELKERTIVIAAANLLQVGEFQLLQLAYRDWFDRDLPEALVSRLFHTYMLKHEVPHWARHYARKILDMDERGEVDDLDPAYHRYDHDYHTHVPEGVKKFCYASAFVAAVVFGGILVAERAGTTSTALLPPFFEKEQLRPAPAGTWGRTDVIPPASTGLNLPGQGR